MDFCNFSIPRHVSVRRAAVARQRTFVSERHLLLQRLEFIRNAGLGIVAHLLAGPLLQAIELPVDVHVAGVEVRVREMCGLWRYEADG